MLDCGMHMGYNDDVSSLVLSSRDFNYNLCVLHVMYMDNQYMVREQAVMLRMTLYNYC